MSDRPHESEWESVLRVDMRQVGRVSRWLCERGWAERNAGNLSLDVTDTVDQARASGFSVTTARRVPPVQADSWLLVTAGGARFRDIAEDPLDGLMLLATSAAGFHIVWDPASGRRPVTSEAASHLRIHARLKAEGTRRRAVLHTHPTHLIALNHAPFGGNETELNRALWAMLPEVKVLVPEGVGLVPYRLPGSDALAEATVTALERHRAVIWDRHGCIAVESDAVEAFDLVDMLDKAARLHLLCLAAGYSPRGLTPDEIADLGLLADQLGIGP